MGVTDKGRTKPRPVMTSQRPSSPRATSGTAPTKKTVTSAAPPALRKEEEKLRGTSAQSSVKSMNITNITTNTNKTKVILAESGAKHDKKNEDKNESENSLIIGIDSLSLNEDNDLNKQIKNLSINDNQEEKEQSEESDLVSRGPDRNCTRGITRTVPYVYGQHIVSSDNHGGGTVLYPHFSTSQTVLSYSHVPLQELHAANFRNSSEVNTNSTIDNGLNVNDYTSELEKLLDLPPVLPNLNAEDVNDVLPSLEGDILSNLFDPSINLDKVIESSSDDKDIQPIKQEIWEVAMGKHRAPATPDSAYDSAYDSPVGSPSSVASGTSDVMRIDREKVVTMNAPYTHLATQPTNLTQSGFAPVSSSPVIQRVPVQPRIILVMPPPPPVLPQPQLQQQPQSVAPPSTPPPSPLRHILPGINITAVCNGCSEPAKSRIQSVIIEDTKATMWAVMFAHDDSEFFKEDDDGNMFLAGVLTKSQRMKNFMEVFYVLISRLKEIINGNREMACKLLATPNKNGYTPLDIACRVLRSSPQNALAVRYLADTMVEEGLAIGEEVDHNGNSLLHRLCLYGDEACYIMAELLSMKDKQGKPVYDVNKKNHEGRTPLHIAAQTHNDRTFCAVLAQLLLHFGADVSVKDIKNVFYHKRQVTCHE